MAEVFDLETNGLLDVVDKIHCNMIYNTETKQLHRFDPEVGLMEDSVRMLMAADTLVGHNIIDYDIPVLKKLYPWFKPKGKVIDTLVWARLAFANIRATDFGRFKKGTLPGNLIGSHKLEAYGYRLGNYKGDYGKDTDWQTWDPEMSEYCIQDVNVTNALYERCKFINVPQSAVDLEMAVQAIIVRQMHHGILFDYKKAVALCSEMMVKRDALRDDIRATFPPFYKPKYSNGKTFTPKRDNAALGYVAGAPCTQIQLVDFNPASNQHIYTMLIKKYGWEPLEFTEKSNEPKIDDEILGAMDYPEAKPLAEYKMLNKRIGQISEGKQAWLKYYMEDTGRIHGYVNPMGTVTFRMSHSHPNIAQCPASYSPYGPECRSCFIVPKGYKLVGCDAAGLEARCLGHFLAPFDGGAYADMVINGKKEDGTDVHTVNAKVLKCSRDDAKTWFYAFIYGAGNGKLGAILGKDSKHGAASKAAFKKSLPALAKLLSAIEKAYKQRGHLLGIDGRKLQVRSIHAALNVVLQSAGALLMKKALVIADQNLQYYGLTNSETGVDGEYAYEFVANVHDEFQAEVLEELTDIVGEIFENSIRVAGEVFNWQCPLDAEYMVGDSWNETH